MHHLSSMTSTISDQFQIPKHCCSPLLLTCSQHFQLTIQRFKERQNTPFHVLFFSAAQTSRTSFQIVSECSTFSPCFQSFLSSSNFQNIVLKSARMHHFRSMLIFFISSSNFKNIVLNTVRMHHLTFSVLVFKLFSLVKEKRK